MTKPLHESRFHETPVVQQFDSETDQGLSAGLTGSMIDVVPFRSDALFQVNVPQHLSRTWMVNILALQANVNAGTTVGALPANAYDVGQRHQAATRYNSNTLKLRLEFGTGDVQEQVIFDYPFNGGTFEVNAAMLRLFLNNPFPGTAIDPVGQANFYSARVGAFVSPRGWSRSRAAMQPTYSTGLINIAATVTETIGAPARAVGYRIHTPSSSILGLTMTLNQNLYDGTVIQWDSAGATVPTNANQPQTQPIYYPWNPMATVLTLRNGGGSTALFQVIWLLDLG